MIINTSYNTPGWGDVFSYKGAEVVGDRLRIGYGPQGDEHVVSAEGGIVEIPLTQDFAGFAALAARVSLERSWVSGGYAETFATHVLGVPETGGVWAVCLTEPLSWLEHQLRYSRFWSGEEAASEEYLRKLEGTGACYSGDSSLEEVCWRLVSAGRKGHRIAATPVPPQG